MSNQLDLALKNTYVKLVTNSLEQFDMHGSSRGSDQKARNGVGYTITLVRVNDFSHHSPEGSVENPYAEWQAISYLMATRHCKSPFLSINVTYPIC